VDAISKQTGHFFHDVFMLYYISKCREPTRLRAQWQRRTTIATAAMLRGDVFDRKPARNTRGVAKALLPTL
jgi:hypothetical protein